MLKDLFARLVVVLGAPAERDAAAPARANRRGRMLAPSNIVLEEGKRDLFG